MNSVCAPSDPLTVRRDGIDGYVDGSLYPSNFHVQFAPAWTDRMLVRHGMLPRRSPRGGFTLIDLGCGDGIGLIVNAASHPEGHFLGIDAIPGHVTRGANLAARCGIANATLRCETFEHALTTPLPAADYVMAQGVLSWVTPNNQAALFALAAKALKPGGVFTVGYNAMPGWSPILAFQRLLRAVAASLSGDPSERFEGACETIRASGLIGKSVFDWLDQKRETLPRDYFAHEYLNRHWQPFWSADVATMATAHGLVFAGSADARRLRDDFGLRAHERDGLAGLADRTARELGTDIAQNTWFRVDQFVKSPFVAASGADADTAWLDGWWASCQPAAAAVFASDGPAGTIRFENEAAHAILAALDDGPAILRSIGGLADADLLNTADALMFADVIRPAEPPAAVPAAAAINAAIRETTRQGLPVNALAGRYGPAALARDTIGTAGAETLARLGVAFVSGGEDR
jgi:SAM-dependent methyltransferase